ncbi:tRNA (adenosine(37)-N6)-threonylcarbamoyltransferase complex dimerization subunit type 1 TsaB [candidate division KSB1 bacterium]|nr:tRNA (adenosine(37)-N6)-threonylcarbamoyltransferase complex dimerization subunit type 1 TsaB [candidate division KSB1 bacterium]
MLTLGIDTSTEICGIALLDEEELLAEMNLNLHRAHSEKLVQAVNDLLQTMDMTPSAIQLIAVSAGPGSFTGLRIGMSAAKGFALSLNLPLTTVVTLDALAFQAPVSDAVICPIIKARKDEVYAAVYSKRRMSEIERISGYRCMKVNQLGTLIPEDTLILGNGTSSFARQIHDSLGERIHFAPAMFSCLRGYSIAYVGLDKYRQTGQNEADSAKPFYIQEFISGAKFRT